MNVVTLYGHADGQIDITIIHIYNNYIHPAIAALYLVPCIKIPAVISQSPIVGAHSSPDFPLVHLPMA
jgi:hypothetical protein